VSEPKWVPFRRRDFWDPPHCVLIEDYQTYYLESLFDDVIDDFEPFLRVYLLPAVPPEAEGGSWMHFNTLEPCIGELPLTQTLFDSTRRAWFDASVLDAFGP
jgi:hypothetical protein